MKRLIHIAILAACACLLSGPLAWLQIGAWTVMVATSGDSWEQAVIDTLGGERACDWCRFIDAVENADHDSPEPARSVDPVSAKDWKCTRSDSGEWIAARPLQRPPRRTENEPVPKAPSRAVPVPPPRPAAA